MTSFIAAPFFSTRPSSTRRQSPRCCVPSPRVSSAVQSVSESLLSHLPSLFDRNIAPDYSLYASTVVFEDPLTRFQGVSRYASNIQFLKNSPVFTDSTLQLYDLQPSPIDPTAIRTRWALYMTVRLPWSPTVAFTGQSDYIVDERSALVVRHVDYWDSLTTSAYFSREAVADLLRQCRSGVSPRDLGGYDLLRRTQALEVRRFTATEAGVALEKGVEKGVEVYTVAKSAPVVVKYAAVVSLKTPVSRVDVSAIAGEMKQSLEKCGYATPTDNVFYVRHRVRNNAFHELWLQLSQASANVDF